MKQTLARIEHEDTPLRVGALGYIWRWWSMRGEKGEVMDAMIYKFAIVRATVTLWDN